MWMLPPNRRQPEHLGSFDNLGESLEKLALAAAQHGTRIRRDAGVVETIHTAALKAGRPWRGDGERIWVSESEHQRGFWEVCRTDTGYRWVKITREGWFEARELSENEAPTRAEAIIDLALHLNDRFPSPSERRHTLDRLIERAKLTAAWDDTGLTVPETLTVEPKQYVFADLGVAYMISNHAEDRHVEGGYSTYVRDLTDPEQLWAERTDRHDSYAEAIEQIAFDLGGSYTPAQITPVVRRILTHMHVEARKLGLPWNGDGKLIWHSSDIRGYGYWEVTLEDDGTFGWVMYSEDVCCRSVETFPTRSAALHDAARASHIMWVREEECEDSCKPLTAAAERKEPGSNA